MTRFLLLMVIGAAWLSGQVPVDRAWSILSEGAADKGADTRARAIRALGLITDNVRAQEMAEKALDDMKPEVQAAAADALGQMGAKSSAERLVEVIKTNNTTVVLAAANALFTMGDTRAYAVYYAVLMGERKSGESLVESQMKVLKDPKALAQMGFEQGIGFIPFAGAGYTAFKMVTKDDTSPVRAAAAQKLVKDNDPTTAQALAKTASDPKWLVRAAVVDAIAKRGDPALSTAVVPLLDDKNEIVRFTAAATIVRLSK